MKDTHPNHANVNLANNVCAFVDINIDGVQMFKTGIRQALPVLARLSALVNDKGEYFLFSNAPVFLVGIFLGKVKPEMDDVVAAIVQEFLQRHPAQNPAFLFLGQQVEDPPERFVSYMSVPRTDMAFDLHDEPSTYTSIYVAPDRFVADGPARSDLTGTIGATGFWAPVRCKQRGKRINRRTVFQSLTCGNSPRTDAEFESYLLTIDSKVGDTGMCFKEKIKNFVHFSNQAGLVMRIHFCICIAFPLFGKPKTILASY